MSNQNYKHDLIHDLFVRTADENYIASRWCASSGLYTDFLWLAVHALEKYLKAVLLINGHSAKVFGHDITKLYPAVRAFAAEFLPERMPTPGNFRTGPWSKSSAEFIQHLWNNGNADNRYLIYGYASGTHDVFQLDQMVFDVRRLICPLDELATDLAGVAVGPSYRQILERNPRFFFPMGMPLDEILRDEGESQLKVAALSQNFAFAPDTAHPAVGRRVVARNPVLVRRIFEPLASNDKKCASQAVKLAGWLLENVQLPAGKGGSNGVREEISLAIAAARAQHQMP